MAIPTIIFIIIPSFFLSPCSSAAAAAATLPPPLNPVQRRDAEECEALAHGHSRGLTEEKTAILGVRSKHLAIHIKAVELLGQIVEVVREAVGCQLMEEILERFGELDEVKSQFLLLRIPQRDVMGLSQGPNILAALADDACNTRMGVEKVHGGVALHVEHFIEAELVVGGAVVLQIGVLDGAIAHGGSDGFDLGLIDLFLGIFATGANGFHAAVLGLIEQFR
mmetsp:Transcript_1931/g.2864  ORF Transcript_1931/g.2864 Transcript_1931/m.2864 type:complete len:223 (+) Transcript_1931:480-1148(+)